ncbi:MAG: HPr kinase/phosphorylase [Rhodobacteraceae bacterium HLUCCO07]|nr:MAG: HPr kinase/phosphorylase [Rhodobacteraceae bacterium HLUCCO07]
MAQAPEHREVFHGSCVAVDGRGILILGASGGGKSALALRLMALGAGLVADDRVIVTRADAGLIATCPPAISGLIEARFVGLLGAAPVGPVPLALVVDLDRAETERLPPRRSKSVLGLELPLLHNVETGHFPAAIMQYLKGGRSD